MDPRITGSVRELGDLLQQVKSQTSLFHSAPADDANMIAMEADEVLRPLMDLLDGSLSMYAQSCEKTVLKRLLKELWKIVIRTLEKTIVLPPMTDRTVGALIFFVEFTELTQTCRFVDGLQAPDGQRQESGCQREDRGHVAADQESHGRQAGRQEYAWRCHGYLQGGESHRFNRSELPNNLNSFQIEKNLSPKQCAVLEVALDTIQQYFHAGGNGLKKPFLEKSSELQSLKYALSLYTQTTDTLIKSFVSGQGASEGKCFLTVGRYVCFTPSF